MRRKIEENPQKVAYNDARLLLNNLRGAEKTTVLAWLKDIYSADIPDDEIQSYVLTMASSPTTGHEVVRDIKMAIVNLSSSAD